MQGLAASVQALWLEADMSACCMWLTLSVTACMRLAFKDPSTEVLHEECSQQRELLPPGTYFFRGQ